ncbi:hypothetical protein JHD50_05215 [Sulfurimonas sp. MAG313]|nr:hypothetical protein [Sulfurimonas sp. MAG313]MDF1880708.1 hypothetical protein [Sulfurimonas sp. MAG313]
MKKTVPSLIAAALIVFTGCGGSDDSTSTSPKSTSANTSVQVERGPILGAVVLDSNGTQATEDANGSYTFDSTPVYPITAYGGYIDVNRNGVIDAGEVKNTIILKAQSGAVLTLLTSILSSQDLNASTILLDDLGLNSALTPGEDDDVAALSDVVYKYLIENNLSNASDLNISELSQTLDQIKIKIEEYDNDDLEVSEKEHILMLELDIKKLDDAEAEEANKRLQDINATEIINSLPDDLLSPEEKLYLLEKIRNHDKEERDDVQDLIEDLLEDLLEDDDSDDEKDDDNDSDEKDDDSDDDDSDDEDQMDDDSDDEMKDILDTNSTTTPIMDTNTTNLPTNDTNTRVTPSLL